MSQLRLLAAACFMFASTLSTASLAQDVPALERAPQDNLPPSGTGLKFVWGGAGMTVGFYGVAALGSYMSSSPTYASDLRLPVVGPWMSLGHVGCTSDDPSCSTFNVVMRSTLSVIDGLGQAGGLLLVLEGLFFPTAPEGRSQSEPKPERGPLKNTPAPKKLFLAPTPLGVGGIGLGVSGNF